MIRQDIIEKARDALSKIKQNVSEYPKHRPFIIPVIIDGVIDKITLDINGIYFTAMIGDGESCHVRQPISGGSGYFDKIHSEVIKLENTII